MFLILIRQLKNKRFVDFRKEYVIMQVVSKIEYCGVTGFRLW